MGATILRDNRAALLQKYENVVSNMLVAAASECQFDAVNAITSGPKTGKTYRLSATKRKVSAKGKAAAGYRSLGLKERDAGGGKSEFITGYKLHRASRPGEAPASDTGYLANSIEVAKVSKSRVLVVVGAEYGRILELGGAHVKPRPYLLPAFVKARRSLGRKLIATFRKG